MRHCGHVSSRFILGADHIIQRGIAKLRLLSEPMFSRFHVTDFKSLVMFLCGLSLQMRALI
jgi:hypothetical protein